MKESKEVLDFVVAMVQSISESIDGEYTYSDAIKFWRPISMLADAVEGIDKVFVELKGMNTTQLDELVQYAKDELDLPHDRVEQIVELAIDVGANLLKLVGLVKSH